MAAENYIWRNVEIVGGGFVTGIIFNQSKPGLVYARTDIGGAYRFDANLKRWMPLTDWVGMAESNLLGIESLATDPVDPNRLYLAAGTYTKSWAGNGAILRSIDQGRTFERTDMPFKMGGNEVGRSIGERLAIDPRSNNILFFGSRDDGLWKSEDFAATWKKVGSFPVTGPTNGVGIGFVIFDEPGGAKGEPTRTIYIGVAAPGVNLYRSTDAGETWQPVPGQPQGLLPHHGALSTDGALYLTYGDGPGPNGMTSGAVWKLETRTGKWTDITPLAPGAKDRFGYAGLAVDARNPATVMVATMDRWARGDDIFRSIDGGAHWKSLKAEALRDSSAAPYLNLGKDSADLGHWIGDVEIDPFEADLAMYVTGATIWGTDDLTAADSDRPTHWTVRAQGLEETAVLDLIGPPAGAHLISGLGDIGGFRHDDFSISPRGGMSANPIFKNTTSLDFAQLTPNVIVRVGTGAAGRQGAYSLDGGTTWKPFAAEPNGCDGAGSIAISADGKVIVWAAQGSRPHLSTDYGMSWSPCKGIEEPVRVIANRADPARFYALDSTGGKLYFSSDAGESFSPGASKLPAGRGSRLKATPGFEGDLWLTAPDKGLYHSTDSGSTFTKLAGVQEAVAIGFGRSAPECGYPAMYLSGKIGEIAGIFRSDDKGASWTRINDDLHQYGWIGVITGDARIYGRLYLGTNGRGIVCGQPR